MRAAARRLEFEKAVARASPPTQAAAVVSHSFFPDTMYWNACRLVVFASMPLSNPRGWLTEIGVAMSRPMAFILYLVYGACWIGFGHGLDWHSVATFITWGMTLFIQRAEHRDTQALHAKLDELLKVHGAARNSLMSLDERDAEEVEKKRVEIQRNRN